MGGNLQGKRCLLPAFVACVFRGGVGGREFSVGHNLNESRKRQCSKFHAPMSLEEVTLNLPKIMVFSWKMG